MTSSLECTCEIDEDEKSIKHLNQDMEVNKCYVCCEYGHERKPIDCVKERFYGATGRLRISFENV
jgi:hypothetical protein